MIGAMVLRNGLNLIGVSPGFQRVVIWIVIIAAVFVGVLWNRAQGKSRFSASPAASGEILTRG